MIYLLSFLGIDNWWPAVIAPAIISFIALIMQRNFKEPDLIIEVMNRYHKLNGSDSPVKDKGVFETSSLIGTGHRSFKKLPFHFYNLDDSTLIKLLIQLSKVYVTDRIIMRIVYSFPFIIFSTILYIFLPLSIVFSLVLIIYFSVIIYDITIIIESPQLNKTEKTLHIILSFLLSYTYSGIISCLYHKFRDVRILEKRLEELKGTQ